MFDFIAFPGYYSMINSDIPDVVYIHLDPNGHVKEPEGKDHEQNQVKGKQNIHLHELNVIK